MQRVLLVADKQNVVDRVQASLAGAEMDVIVHADSATAATTAYAEDIDVVLVDMQVGSMGSMAVTRDVRAKSEGGEEIPVTILLDREADAFLAGRSGAKSWILKSAPAAELRAALTITS
jgi:DNA-binding response OmpR family regulator